MSDFPFHNHFTLAEVAIVERWRRAHPDHVICSAKTSPGFRLRNRTLGEIAKYLQRNPRAEDKAA